MFRPIALTLALAAAAPVAAQEVDRQAATGQPPQRVRSVTLSGDQACPKSTDEEVVVCSRIDPEEQYRIPKEMRDTQEVAANRSSWVNRTATIDQVGRQAGGLPNTCSPNGFGGQTGCALMANRAYAAEKRAAERNDALVPGGGD